MKFRKQIFMDITSRNSVKIRSEPVIFNGTQKIYDFDVFGSSRNVKRIKFVTFNEDRNDFPLTGNLYSGESTKNGFEAKSYAELVKLLK